MAKKEDIVIRRANLGDALAILHIQKEVVSEGDYLITLSEEFNKTLEQQREWIGKILQNDKETILVPEIPNEIVGWIVLISPNRIRLSHNGSIGMMIKKDYRSMGIGKLLMKGMLDWAEQNPFIEKVSLGVFSTNERAIALYNSMGFIEEGRKIKEFKMDTNEYVDDILMYKLV
ncbi:N-acetyltransferase [Bacillus sp. ISL-45]|uniref:GNAT family N-acetyltransferase n=1 Tax=Bacillus sp. ISL-45 TaxID=2819128 RepID=UPI001BEA9165|nr:N-acetyltransferase [Bacillus sp. ISL-45]MBT2663306.1 GNAT family N-acetyltransferase [Bacillus sp. ISL-45]